MTIDLNPEFGIEITLGVPYAYWLHLNNRLDKVITSKGMQPFYFFCKNVEEKYQTRTIDNNAAGMKNLPNNWIYGHKENAALYKDEWEDWRDFSNVERGCGILDYSKWEVPDYVQQYKDDPDYKLDRPFIVISNRYNFEHGHPPLGYFDIEAIYNITLYLTSKGYAVVYKRPDNTEGFPLDQNEVTTVLSKCKLQANVEGYGILDDYELIRNLPHAYLLNDFCKKNPNHSYNEVQLKLFSNAAGFVTIAGGGSTLLPALFKKPTVSYFGRAMQESSRENFFSTAAGKVNIQNYHYKLNPNLVPFIDRDGKDMVQNKYREFLKKVKEVL